MNFRVIKWNSIGTFGTFLIALAAFFRPDIEALIKGNNVVATLPHEFVFNHRIGVLWVLPWVDIKNEGAKSIDIREISIYLINPDRKFIKLTGDSYINRAFGGADYFPWTTLTLKPDQRWVDRVNFREPLDQISEEKFRSIIAELGEHWGELDLQTFLESTTGKMSIINDNNKLLHESKKFFKENFKLTHGHYKMLLVLKSDKNEIITSSAYELTLFESTIISLEKRVDEYLNSSKSFFDGSLLTSIPLIPIENKNEINEIIKYINP